MSAEDKQALRKMYAKLCPAQLKRQSMRLQQTLYKLHAPKQSPMKKAAA
jgi:hypothetical protein